MIKNQMNGSGDYFEKLINFDFVEDKEECNKRRSMVMAAIALSAKTKTKVE